MLFALLRLVEQQHRNAIANGIDPAAPGALKRLLIGRECELFAALRCRAHQDIEQLLQHHALIKAHALLTATAASMCSASVPLHRF